MIRNPFRFGTALILMAVLLIAAGCGVDQGKPGGAQGSSGGGGQATATPVPTPSPTPQPSPEPSPSPSPENDGPELLDSDKHPEITIEMSNGGIIKVELYPEVAPNTVNNFISLVEQQFYDGLMFHRVIPGFMIQGGDPDATGMGGPGYSIPGEFTANGFENKLKHTRGVISMARSGNPDSAGSQFFIMVEDYPSLDKQYASFGKVIEGMEVVDEIVNQKTDLNDKPIENPLTMTKVTVDKKGMTFEEPVKTEQ
jgi:Peptidyl-prolyl cis-trans isomerase (rotamase) - cyclophilin family